MPNEHRNPTQEERDERIALPLDPDEALRALLAVDPDDEEPSNMANLPGLRTKAEWDHLTNKEVNALGKDAEPKSRPAKRTRPQG